MYGGCMMMVAVGEGGTPLQACTLGLRAEPPSPPRLPEEVLLSTRGRGHTHHDDGMMCADTHCLDRWIGTR